MQLDNDENTIDNSDAKSEQLKGSNVQESANTDAQNVPT